MNTKRIYVALAALAVTSIGSSCGSDANDASMVEGDHFPEEAEGIEVIDEIGEYDAGTTETLSVTLERGSYQLVCNLPGHYANGMFLGFDVVT